MLKRDNLTSGRLRNKPCICGSGKKYKRCCYSKYNVFNDMSVLGFRDMLKRIRYAMMKHWHDTGEMLSKEDVLMKMLQQEAIDAHV